MRKMLVTELGPVFQKKKILKLSCIEITLNEWLLINKIKNIIQKFFKVPIIICDLMYLKQKLNQSNIYLNL